METVPSSENCPLESGESTGEHTVKRVPSFCLSHCYDKWSEALKNSIGELDDYQLDTDECDHTQHQIEFSHEALQRPDDSSLRNYVIVDECVGCREDLQETNYQFSCPYSTNRQHN